MLVMDEFRFIYLVFFGWKQWRGKLRRGGGYWGGEHIDAFMSGGYCDAFTINVFLNRLL